MQGESVGVVDSVVDIVSVVGENSRMSKKVMMVQTIDDEGRKRGSIWR